MGSFAGIFCLEPVTAGYRPDELTTLAEDIRREVEAAEAATGVRPRIAVPTKTPPELVCPDGTVPMITFDPVAARSGRKSGADNHAVGGDLALSRGHDDVQAFIPVLAPASASVRHAKPAIRCDPA